MRRIRLLPNLVTLGNAFCGVLAICTAIDALIYSGTSDVIFFQKLERACLLVILGMLFDAADGFVARLTRGSSEYGAQLDSFADALTFGLTPALLVKVLIGHEMGITDGLGGSRVHFLAVGSFALLAILRLVRFNLDNDSSEAEDHRYFRGLPSPAAAGCVISFIWVYLVLAKPELEVDTGTPTPLRRFMEWTGSGRWEPAIDVAMPLLLVLLPVLGLLMVSGVRYLHPGVALTSDRHPFVALVWFVFGLALFYLAPVPFLFITFNAFVWGGLIWYLVRLARRRPRRLERREAA